MTPSKVKPVLKFASTAIHPVCSCDEGGSGVESVLVLVEAHCLSLFHQHQLVIVLRVFSPGCPLLQLHHGGVLPFAFVRCGRRVRRILAGPARFGV